MAKECIQGCWRIRQEVNRSDTNNMWAGPLAIHPDMFSGDGTSSERLLDLCEATYDCVEGPGEEEVEVVKGFFRKRIETQKQPTCGLPDEYFER